MPDLIVKYGHRKEKERPAQADIAASSSVLHFTSHIWTNDNENGKERALKLPS